MTKGGRRHNAGAKPKGKTKRVAISVTIEEELLKCLMQDKTNTGRSCSDSINIALRAYYANTMSIPASEIDLEAITDALNAF